MELKDRLKQRRLELGLTLEEVGNIVGVGKSTVRKWETGYIENMRRDKIVLLSKALKVSPDFIMQDDTDYINSSVHFYEKGSESENNIFLNKEEISIINKYRKTDSFGQETVKFTVDREYTRTQEQKHNIGDSITVLKAARSTTHKPIEKVVMSKEQIDKIQNAPTISDDDL